MDDSKALLGFLCVAAAAKYATLLRSYKRRPKHAKLVGQVSQLLLHPVKSCAVQSLEEAACTYSGLRDIRFNVMDRHFMVGDEKGHFVSQRKYPRMSLIVPSLHQDGLHLDAPGMDTLVVPHRHHGKTVACDVWNRKSIGMDCGDAAADWFTKYIGSPVRLFATDPETQTVNMATAGSTQWHKATKRQDKTGFHDFGPYVFATQGSLDDVNRKLKNEIDMRRFRPNVVIEGTAAFEEDNWCEIYIGDETKFHVLKPCDRCIFTTVITDQGEKDPERQPIETLKRYRIDPDVSLTSPIFGVHPTLELGGTIRIGDPVYAVYGPRWWQKK